MTEEIINELEVQDVQPALPSEPEKPTVSVFEMMQKYFQMTGLKLDPNCHLDSEFVSKWYEKQIVSGIHIRYVLPKGATITHYGDGIIYKSTNITDAIAIRLMDENPEYKKIFIDLGE